MVLQTVRARLRDRRAQRDMKRRLYAANPSLAHMERRSWVVLFLIVLGLLMHGPARADEEVVTYYLSDEQGTVLDQADAAGHSGQLQIYTPFGDPLLPLPQRGKVGYANHIHDDIRGLVYMQARHYDAHIGRFLSVDPVVGAPGQLADFNRYAYGRNNPHRYVDPDGRQVLGVSAALRGSADPGAAADAAIELIPGIDLGRCAMNGCSAADWAMAGAQEFKPVKAAKITAKAVKAVNTGKDMTAVVQKGKRGEAAVRERYDIGRTTKINVNGKDRYPDGLVRGRTISESKNVSYQGNTSQLKDYAQFADAKDLKFNLYINENAKISGPLQQAADRGDVTIIKVSMD